MSDLEKTGSKLIDSIRKTKAGPETAAVETAKEKTATPKVAKPKVSSTTSVKPSSKPKKRATKAKKATPKPRASVIEQVPYPDGSQVWPD